MRQRAEMGDQKGGESDGIGGGREGTVLVFYPKKKDPLPSSASIPTLKEDHQWKGKVESITLDLLNRNTYFTYVIYLLNLFIYML